MVKNILIVLFLFLIPRIEAQKIFSVKYDNRADLKVFVVKYESRVGENQGKWFFVDYESRADLKIFFVDYESRAGWKNKSKKHLLY